VSSAKTDHGDWDLFRMRPDGSDRCQVTDTREIVRQYPRKGMVSQLVWSPDGKRFIGTANGLGPFWNIGCLDPFTGSIRAVGETQRYNCTPDWTPDARQVVYARGIIPEQGGRAELRMTDANQGQGQTLYAEEGRHIYGACVSPDGRYLLFTRSIEDLGKVNHAGTTMSIIRWADTPMVGDSSVALRARLPRARSGPRLDLGRGWEPHWTGKEIEK
jgi:dipeptidyl aminopeptidase/acylaminoacyl peptidase